MAKFVSLAIITTLILMHVTEAANPPYFKNIYAFGDSFTDTGNTRSNPGDPATWFIFVSNPPYGRTFFHHPTNRYSDGRLVIDFVAESLSLQFLPPYLNQSADRPNGVNFAVSGSTAIDHNFFVVNRGTFMDVIPQSLGTELEWFEKLLKEKGCVDSASTPRECEGVFNDSLIWVGEMGANDYAYSVGSDVPPQTVQQLAINSINDFLQALLKKGARYVVVQGLPPTGCLSFSMLLGGPLGKDATGCSGAANLLSSTHNQMLKSKLDSFRKNFPQSIIVYADYYEAYMSVLKNAKSYGFTDVFNVCCGFGGMNYNIDYTHLCGSPLSTSCPDPSKYINWDGVHLTEAMYKVVADLFINGNYTQPPFGSLLDKKRQSRLLEEQHNT
ncbi:hypothetical protein ACS0TY_022202 [Phlomoides rotata]